MGASHPECDQREERECGCTPGCAEWIVVVVDQHNHHRRSRRSCSRCACARRAGSRESHQEQEPRQFLLLFPADCAITYDATLPEGHRGRHHGTARLGGEARAAPWANGASGSCGWARRHPQTAAVRSIDSSPSGGAGELVTRRDAQAAHTAADPTERIEQRVGMPGQIARTARVSPTPTSAHLAEPSLHRMEGGVTGGGRRTRTGV